MPHRHMDLSTPSPPPLDALEVLLQQHWGHARFRENQVPVVQAAAAGQDVLAVLPTGGGKSICYQVPGLYRGGVCLVISPLVALMADQVAGLKKAGLSAEAITGALSPDRLDQKLSRFRHGPGGFLFVAPERLQNPAFEAACRDMPVRTIAVDEAHCISQWGHAFRADYLHLHRVRDWHLQASWIALTATATPRVEQDVVQCLGLREPRVIRMPMRRENLAFRVEHVRDRMTALTQWAREAHGSGLLYVRTRRDAEDMALFLAGQGHAAAAYHAGLDRPTRDERQAQWSRGKLQFLACTTAFGMGIDKPDVRHIGHLYIPESPEGYVQEAGRAGRDGQLATATLFVDDRALPEAEERVRNQWPTLEQVQAVLQAVANQLDLAVGSVMEDPVDVELSDLARRAKVSRSTAAKALDLLSRNQTLELHPPRGGCSFEWSSTPERRVEFSRSERPDASVLRGLMSLEPSDRIRRHLLDLNAMAAGLDLSVSRLTAHLNRLEELDLLHWSSPASRVRLSFPNARPDVRTFQLPSAILADRVKESNDRWAAMQAYVTGDSCRALLLEAWFGEDEARTRCGRCDVCLPNATWGPEDLLNAIGTGISSAELRRLIPARDHDPVRDMLETLRAQGKLTWRSGWIEPRG